MITYWQKNDIFIQLPKFENGCWMDVTNPTNEEIDYLVNEFKIPNDFITDILDTDELSRIEIEGKWMLIILRIPVSNNNNNSNINTPFYTIPLGALISNQCIITVCSIENEIIKDIQNPQRGRIANISDRIHFILNLLLKTANLYLRYLKQINIITTQIENDLELATRNAELNRLLRMDKCLVYFMTSLKSNELVLSKLRSSKIIKESDMIEDLLEDVIIENRQALEMAKVYSDLQASRMETFASVISNNLNAVMKRLTSVTIILMIPTLVASLFGMNLINYLEENKYGFLIVTFISFVLTIFGVMLFRKKDWF